MKKKIGTLLDEKLLFKVKKTALSQRKTLSEFIENALRLYLLTLNVGQDEKQMNISQSTKGKMQVSRRVLKAIMEEEGMYET